MKLTRVLARVRGKSAAEVGRLLARRGRRAALGLLAEARARALGPHLSDDDLVAAVPGAADAADAVERVRAKLGRPLVGEPERDRLVALLDRYPTTREALLGAAASALSGAVDLLGSGPRPLGATPDWQHDFKSGGVWDAGAHHSRLRAVRLDGSDVKVPWELSRLQQLPMLASAHLLTRDEAIPFFFGRQVEDWIARNPPGFGANWLCTMDVAMRATSLAWAYALLHRSPVLDAGFHRAFLRSMLEHGRFIAANLEDGGFTGNHFLADLSGLSFLAESFPAFRDSAAWSARARAALEREIRRQVLHDGADFEASTSYHRLVLELLLLPALLSRRNGQAFAPGYWRRLKAMFALDAAIQNAAGLAPQFGDNDSGRGFRILPRADLDHGYLNGLAAAIFGEASLCAGRPPEVEAAFLVGPAAFERVEKGGGARPGSAAFPDGGVYVLRCGPAELFIRCGNKGQDGLGGHAHNDALSFELSVGGQRLVVDPGSGSYTGDPELRNRLRATAAHSTLVLDGKEQCPFDEDDLFALPDRLELAERAFDAEAGTFAGTIVTPDHRHRRFFELGEDHLRVRDEISPEAGFELRLTLAVGLEAAAVEGGARAGPVQVTSTAPLKIVDAQYSPSYGKVETTRAILIRGRGATLEMVFRFAPP